MTHTHGTTLRRPTRRRLLGLVCGSAVPALLGVGATGCRSDDEAGAGTTDGGGEAPAKGSGASGDDSGTPGPLWTTAVPVQDGGVNDELMALDGTAVTLGNPLSAWDGATGRKRWSAAGAAVPGAPLLHANGTLYLASGEYDGSIGGFDPATGRETWRSRLGKEYDQPRPVAADDTQVYVIATILKDGLLTPTNVIAALDGTTGRVVWKEQRDAGTEENGINAIVQDGHLVYTDFRKNLTVRDTATGRQIWTHKTSKVNYDSFAAHQDLVIVAQQRELRAYSLADGSDRWSLRTGEFAFFKVPMVVEDVLYVADGDKNLWAVDPATGKEIYRAKGLAGTSAGVPVRFAKAGDTLYGATELDEDGGVHAFDARTGALRWTFNDGSGDIKEWRVATDGKRVFALHGPKLHALPV